MSRIEEAKTLINEAQAARNRDWPRAAFLAAELRNRFPEFPTGYRIGSAAARAMGAFDQALAIIADATPRFPTEAWPLAEAARIAKERGDFDEATRLTEELRNRFPANAVGYQMGSALARDNSQFDVSSAIIAEAKARFSAKAWPSAEEARIAKARGDVDKAIRLAEELRRRFPDDPAGYQIGSSLARDTGQLKASSSIIAAGAARFPAEAWTLTEAAWTAKACGDVDEAIRLAAELRHRFPDNQSGYQSGATFLNQKGRLDEAEDVLRASLARFPAETWPHKELVSIVRRRANRADAAKLIQNLRGALPQVHEPAPETRSEMPPLRGKVVVLLGMHRAGTSLCAKILQRLGAALGSPLTNPGFDNPDGFQEHEIVLECHRMLLEATDADWDTIHLVNPPRDLVEGDERLAVTRNRLRDLVAEQVEAAGSCVWAFKDPRTIRFLPLWRQVFAELQLQPIWIVAVRDPGSVAASLFARDGIDLAIGELLWAEHYLEALRHVGSDIAAIVHYERWFSDARAQAEELVTAIGAVTDETIEEACRAIRVDLRHHAREDSRGALELAVVVHRWLSAEGVDRARLQCDAADLWRQIKRLVHSEIQIRP